MKYRALPRVVAVHMALIEERESVVERLTAINAVLRTVGISTEPTNPVHRDRAKEKKSTRPKDTPLVQIVLDFSKKEPKPIVEILEHLRSKKFKFASGSPLNELLAALEKSFAIEDYGGKIGPVGVKKWRRQIQ